MRLKSLVGLPGSGKSTVGKQLARSLRLDFIDVDSEIERRIGTTIRDFFEREGEQSFRDIEEAVLGECMSRTDAVVATGGGAVLRPANRRALRESSSVIYLRASPEALFRRLRHDARRPLLQVADPLRALQAMYQARDPLYREAAHYVIETGRPTVSNLVGLILMQLELAGDVDPSVVPATIGTLPLAG